MVKKTRELRALAQRATPQAAAAAITRRRQAAATRREEDQRALLSEAATLRGALFRSLSESPCDVYNRPRLEHFDLANWNGVLASLGPDHFIHAALEQRRVATAAARADSDEQRALWDSD
jgi:hypothetical protein